MVLVGLLAAAASSRFFGNDIQRIQKSRDHLVAAFFSAQQLAMAQRDPVRLVVQTNSTSGLDEIDLQQNSGAGFTSLRFWDGQNYPLALDADQGLTAATFNFDRLGQTAARNLTLTQGSSSTTISINEAGFVQ